MPELPYSLDCSFCGHRIWYEKRNQWHHVRMEMIGHVAESHPERSGCATGACPLPLPRSSASGEPARQNPRSQDPE